VLLLLRCPDFAFSANLAGERTIKIIVPDVLKVVSAALPPDIRR
jgi:hypothetical protein